MFKILLLLKSEEESIVHLIDDRAPKPDEHEIGPKSYK